MSKKYWAMLLWANVVCLIVNIVRGNWNVMVLNLGAIMAIRFLILE